MRKLLLKNRLSLGDIVLLTAAVRDLHWCYPKRFVTGVRTSCMALWENNPHATALDESDRGVEVIECSFPLIDRCNEEPYHCLHGFIQFLNERLKLHIRPTAFQGDIHLSPPEKSWYSQVQEQTGEDTPFWIIAAGGKYDVTIKWWDTARYQRVVDHFRGKIQFVQVGHAEHHHPKLEGVIDLRGQTDVRQLVRLVYHAQGVLGPITGLMHLAAAVEVKGGRPAHRPCVVIAGGREPVHWEAYPHHQFIHTLGALPCCQHGGCWRSRTKPLGDGDERDAPENLCVNVVGDLPRCMDMIPAEEVIRRIETYFDGGTVAYLSRSQARAAQRAVAAATPNPVDKRPLTVHNARLASEAFIRRLPAYPGGFRGRGIVLCAGGVKFFPNAWVCLHRLRRLGCKLPIQLWHRGAMEFDEAMAALVAPLGVECVDASVVRQKHPARILNGWEMKPYAILHSRFKEVLFLDADNVPVVNPAFLFDTPQFKETGAIFWPDYNRTDQSKNLWQYAGVERPDELEFETGQIVLDKKKCWAPLRLCAWYNEHSDFFYKHTYGDKETFHVAFRKLGRPYAFVPTPIHPLEGTMCQHDFAGRRIFQHRNTDKWNLFLRNKRVRGFLHEAECRGYVRQLQQLWDGRMSQYERQWKFHPPARNGRPIRIAACMITCPPRADIRRRTLRSFAATDWGDAPFHVQMDHGRAGDAVTRMIHNARRALTRSLEGDPDFILFLEDDLVFNRHLRHNLLAWAPLTLGAVTLASLYDPGVTQLACDARRHFFITHPHSLFGSQALLLSSETARFVLEHWEELDKPIDLRMAHLTARLGQPLFYHAPSLVQHVPVKSTWGGAHHEAADFDPAWRAHRPNRVRRPA